MDQKLLDIIGKLKKNHMYLYIFLVGLIFIIYFRLNLNKLLNLNNWTQIVIIMKEISIIMVNHLLIIVFAIASFITIKKWFKYSDIKSREKIDFINKPTINIIKSKYIYIEIIEKLGEINGRVKVLEINIKNKFSDRLCYLEGKIFLYRNQKRIKVIKFNVEHLDHGYKESIFYNPLKGNEIYWNEADVFIDKIEFQNEFEENIFIKGVQFFRTYTEILNYDKYYDYKLFGIRTKYNLVYLKERIRELKSRLKYYWRNDVISFTDRIKISKKKVFIRVIIILISIILIILLMMVVLDLFNAIKDIGELAIK